MTTFYLLVMMSIGYGGAPSYDTQKFYTEQACKEARASILKLGVDKGMWGSDAKPKIMECVPIQDKLPSPQYSI